MKSVILFVLSCSLYGISLGQIIVDPTQIYYKLYTSQTRATGTNITASTNLTNAIDITKPLKVLIHGWLSDSSTAFMEDTKEAYFNRSITNVIKVDWSVYASAILSYTYVFPVLQSKAVGDAVADVLIAIVNQTHIPWENIHLIGHSLGAHVSGFAGQRVINLIASTNKKIGRITGLDVAGPGYLTSALLPPLRLSSNDAIFVDIIHTSALAGYSLAIGAVDFFVNGGVIQPNCSGPCGHNRAMELFTESIQAQAGSNMNQFIGWDCNFLGFCSCIGGSCCQKQQNVMGEDVDMTKPGIYYLKTNTATPFAQGAVCS